MSLRTDFEASLFRAVAREPSINAKFDLRRTKLNISPIARRSGTWGLN